MTAGYQKIFSRRPDARLPRAGATSSPRSSRPARVAAEKLARDAQRRSSTCASTPPSPAFFMALVALIVVDAVRVWLRRGGERLSPALERARG